MAECERISKCSFFNDSLAEMPAVSGLLKQTYCLADKTICARYMLASAGFVVPKDLFPDDVARARKLLAKASKNTGR